MSRPQSDLKTRLMSFWQHRIVLLALLILGFLFRIFELVDRSLWFDEAASHALVSRFTWREMMTRIQIDVHPPLFYVLLRLWTDLFGDSVAALRSFSVFFGEVTLIGVYLFCRDGFGKITPAGLTATDESRRIALFAIALAALSSPHIEWSREARMYALGTALAALSSWTLIRALFARRATAWWLAYSLTATVFLYTHYYALFTVAAQALFTAGVLLQRSRWSLARSIRSVKTWQSFAAFAAIAIAFLPWLPVLQNQIAAVRSDFWIGPSGPWGVAHAWFRLFIPCNCTTPPGMPASLFLMLLLIGILAILVRERRPAAILVVALTLVPTLIAWIVSLTTVSIMISRYFLFAHLFALCAISAVVILGQHRRHWPVLRWIAPAVVIATLLIQLHYQSDLAVADRPGIRSAVAHILQHRRRSEPIVVLHPAIYFSATYYAPDADIRLYYPTGPVKHYYGAAMLTPEDFIAPSRLPSNPGSRVWVLSTTGFSTGFETVSLPPEWHPVAETREWFHEVYAFQKSVVVGAYERDETGIVD